MLQVPRKTSAKTFSEHVAGEKPEGLTSAEHQLRAARKARQEHTEQLRKVANEYHGLDVGRSSNGVTASTLEQLLDEMAHLKKKSPDFEANVGAARRILEAEREAFAPTFAKLADDAARDLLRSVNDAIAIMEHVTSSLAAIEHEAAAIGRASQYGPFRANRILTELREYAKALGNA
jgi:hypothetical protein